jgi:hypothetical protein
MNNRDQKDSSPLYIGEKDYGKKYIRQLPAKFDIEELNPVDC